MAISKDKKQEILKTLKDMFEGSKIAVFVEYKGTTVEQMDKVRKDLRSQNIQILVTKKTLIQKVAKDLGVELDLKSVKKPLAIITGEDEIMPAKAIAKHSKEIKSLELFGAIMGNKVLNTEEIIALSKLPGKEELLGKLVYLLTYPIKGFMTVSNGNLMKFIYTLNAIQEKKGAEA